MIKAAKKIPWAEASRKGLNLASASFVMKSVWPLPEELTHWKSSWEGQGPEEEKGREDEMLDGITGFDGRRVWWLSLDRGCALAVHRSHKESDLRLN